MKLSILYEANFLPQLDPKQAKKHGINNELLNLKAQPRRSGNLETPPSDPRHRKFMGVEKDHGTMAQKRGRPQSQNIRPEPAQIKSNSFQDLGQPYQRGIENTVVGDDAELSSVDQNDPLGYSGTRDGYAHLRGPGEDAGTQRSTAPSMRRFQAFGNRYPGRR